MKRLSLLVIPLALALAALGVFGDFGARVALADGATKSVVVKPLAPMAGDRVTVKGELLGRNSTVEVRVIGAGVNVDLGEVQANDEGDFTAQFTLPSSLPVGTYRVRATGADSATTEITVLGGTGTTMDMTADTTSEEPAALRTRPVGQTAALIAVFGVLAGLGLFLARTANRGRVVSGSPA